MLWKYAMSHIGFLQSIFSEQPVGITFLVGGGWSSPIWAIYRYVRPKGQKGYGFILVLVRNRVWILHSNLE